MEWTYWHGLHQIVIWNLCPKVFGQIFPTQVLATAYYGLTHAQLAYGCRELVQTISSKESRLQKPAVRPIAKIDRRESYNPYYTTLNILTLPASIFWKQRCIVCPSVAFYGPWYRVQGHNTRDRNNYRTERHRTVIYERLLSQTDVLFTNRLAQGLY